MRSRAAGLAAVVAVVAVLAACSDGGGGPAPGARRPDDAGVVTAVTPTRLTLDDGVTYPFAAQVASFSTYTLEPLPLSHRLGEYVHVGLDDGAVVWLAAIGVLTQTRPQRVIYTGDLLRIDGDGNAQFADGTVLRLGEGVTPGITEGAAQVRIDPYADTVVELLPA